MYFLIFTKFNRQGGWPDESFIWQMRMDAENIITSVCAQKMLKMRVLAQFLQREFLPVSDNIPLLMRLPVALYV
jgi:hypothetical protein